MLKLYKALHYESILKNSLASKKFGVMPEGLCPGGINNWCF